MKKKIYFKHILFQTLFYVYISWSLRQKKFNVGIYCDLICSKSFNNNIIFQTLLYSSPPPPSASWAMSLYCPTYWSKLFFFNFEYELYLFLMSKTVSNRDIFYVKTVWYHNENTSTFHKILRRMVNCAPPPHIVSVIQTTCLWQLISQRPMVSFWWLFYIMVYYMVTQDMLHMHKIK